MRRPIRYCLGCITDERHKNKSPRNNLCFILAVLLLNPGSGSIRKEPFISSSSFSLSGAKPATCCCLSGEPYESIHLNSSFNKTAFLGFVLYVADILFCIISLKSLALPLNFELRISHKIQSV